MKPPALADVCLLRRQKLSRVLAICAAVHPVEVLPLVLDGLKIANLNDEPARRFLTTLAQHADEIQEASRAGDLERVGVITFAVIQQERLFFEYGAWLLSTGEYTVDKAVETIEEFQRNLIASNYFIRLSDFAADVEARSAWKR